MRFDPLSDIAHAPERPRRAPAAMAAVWALVALLLAAPLAWARAADPLIMEVAAVDVCTAVEGYKPVAPGRRFAAEVGKLYCLTRIGSIPRPTRIVHIWYLDGQERMRATLPVKPPSWRTYSWKRISAGDVGNWRVEVTDAAGNVMQAVFFEVTGP
jgi:hypothetical protein